VFVSVDIAAHVVGFVIQPGLVSPGQVTTISSNVAFFVPHQVVFPALQSCRFPWRKPSAPDAVCNSVLLILFAAVDLIDTWMAGVIHAGTRIPGVGILRYCGAHQKATECECEKHIPEGHEVLQPYTTLKRSHRVIVVSNFLRSVVLQV
jgi:hypothetical protein